MTQLEIRSSMVPISSTSLPDLQTARRLIVLVPEFDVDPVLIARKVRELTLHFENRVQLLGLCSDVLQEPGLQRRLITLSAHIEDAHILVETKIEFGRNWLKALQPYWREGDLIVCFTEAGTGLRTQALRQLLSSKVGTSIYVVADFQPRINPSFASFKSAAFAWMGSFAFLAFFFWLQAKIFPLMPNGWGTILFYISIVVEAASIWLVNSIS